MIYILETVKRHADNKFFTSDARNDWSPTNGSNGSVPITGNAQVFFNNPDMGFFGVSSPPGSINKVSNIPLPPASSHAAMGLVRKRLYLVIAAGLLRANGLLMVS